MTEASVEYTSPTDSAHSNPQSTREGWDLEDDVGNHDDDEGDLTSEAATTDPVATTIEPTTRTSVTSSQKLEDDEPEETAKKSEESEKDEEGGSMFDCNICLEQPEEPVVTMCGHLFCWACLFRWLELHPEYQTCPVCKAGVTVDKVIPLYGRGKEEKDPRTRRPVQTSESTQVPRRPQGQRAEPVYQFVPPFSGLFPGTTPFATTQIGNVSFSAGFSIFPSLLGLQFVGATGSVAAGGRPDEAANIEQQQQQAFLSRMLFMLGTVVVIFLLLFN